MKKAGHIQKIYKKRHLWLDGASTFYAEIRYDSHSSCNLELTAVEAIELNVGDVILIEVKWNDGGRGQRSTIVRPIQCIKG